MTMDVFWANSSNDSSIELGASAQEKNRPYTALRILRLISYSLVLLLHLSNITVIRCKRKLHTTCGWLLVSLSVSDVFLLLINLYIEGSKQRVQMDVYIYCIFGLCYIASLLANLGISVDKYIAVQYSLRYHAIVTKRNLVKAIAVLWLSSTLASVLLAVVANLTDQMLYFHVTHYVLRFVCSLLLLACAFHIRNIRNLHQKDMLKRRRHRGMNEDPSNHLKKIKSSVSDVIRLNVISAIIVIIVNTTSAMYRYGALQRNPVLYEIMVVANGLYLISNPIIYISVIKDLRKAYLTIFRCNKARVETSLDNASSVTT